MSRILSKTNPRREERGFTLVELLIVVAILAILAALLLPVLTRAKGRALEIACLNNMKQLATTYQLYSDDNSGKLVPNGYGFPPTPGVNQLWVTGCEHIVPEAFTNVSYITDPNYALFAHYLPSPDVYKCPADRTTFPQGGVQMPRLRDYSLNSFFNWQYPAFDQPDSTSYHNFQTEAELEPFDTSDIFTFVDTSPWNVCYSGFVIYMGTTGWFWHRPSVEHNNNSGNLAFADGHAENHAWVDPNTVVASRTGGTDGSHFLFYPGNLDLIWLQQHATVPITQ